MDRLADRSLTRRDHRQQTRAPRVASLSARELVRRAAFALGLAALPACHHAAVLTPAELQQMHTHCESKLADGSLKLHATPSVGFRAEKPPGTPVVIYGASWCVACDDAAAYLTLQRIPFVERDVETSSVETEAEGVLRAAGLAPSVHSLPVIDVRGTVTIGFAPCVIDAAWRGPREVARCVGDGCATQKLP